MDEMKLTMDDLTRLSQQAGYRRAKNSIERSNLTKGWSDQAITRLAFDIARLETQIKYNEFMDKLGV